MLLPSASGTAKTSPSGDRAQAHLPGVVSECRPTSLPVARSQRTKVRFRLIGGAFRIRVYGTGINLSVVGKGTVGISGAGTADDGTYSLDGGDYVPVPGVAITLTLP